MPYLHLGSRSIDRPSFLTLKILNINLLKVSLTVTWSFDQLPHLSDPCAPWPCTVPWSPPVTSRYSETPAGARTWSRTPLAGDRLAIGWQHAISRCVRRLFIDKSGFLVPYGLQSKRLINYHIDSSRPLEMYERLSGNNVRLSVCPITLRDHWTLPD